MKYTLEINAIGLLCPLPVLKLRKRIINLQSGSIIKILADDPAAIIDIPHFCKENDHIFLTSNVIEETPSSRSHHEYFIQKA